MLMFNCLFSNIVIKHRPLPSDECNTVYFATVRNRVNALIVVVTAIIGGHDVPTGVEELRCGQVLNLMGNDRQTAL